MSKNIDHITIYSPSGHAVSFESDPEAKQAILADLLSVMPEKQRFEYAGTNPNGGIYATFEDAYKAGEADTIAKIEAAIKKYIEGE